MTKRLIATIELLLIAPAALFMAALFARNLTPKNLEPSLTMQRIVMWYSAQPHIGLWVFLIALPLATFLIGAVTLASSRNELAVLRGHIATLLILATTAGSCFVLACIALHMMTD